MKNFLRSLTLTAMALSLSHCGDSKSQFQKLQEGAFSGCAASGCHQPGTNVYTTKIALDMSGSPTAVYAALTSTTITNTINPGCQGIPVIKASDYDHSLFKAMAGSSADRTAFATANGGCSPQRFSDMGVSLTTTNITDVQNWVNSGAPAQ